MSFVFAHDVRTPTLVEFSDGDSMEVHRTEECTDIANVHFHGSKSVCVPRVAVVETEPAPKQPRKGLTRKALGKGRLS